MNGNRGNGTILVIFLLALSGFTAFGAENDPSIRRVAVVTRTPGCVAFWDFVKREPGGARRFTAHLWGRSAHRYKSRKHQSRPTSNGNKPSGGAERELLELIANDPQAFILEKGRGWQKR